MYLESNNERLNIKMTKTKYKTSLHVQDNVFKTDSNYNDSLRTVEIDPIIFHST